MTEAKQLSRKTNFFVAFAIFLFAFFALFITDKNISITWDEPAYITAGESYAGWFGELVQNPGYALSAEGIETYWEANHEHPPLDKIWSGLVWAAVRPFLPDLTAHRLGNIILNSLLFAMLYLLVQDVYGWLVGVLASVFLFSMPRVFFHAHLSALDLVTATMIVAVVLLFWKTRQNPSWWVDIALGVVWGLAVATKVNAVFVYFVLVIWILAYQRQWLMVRRLLVMGALAIPVFFLSWPWLYHDTLARVWEYVLFITVDHWEIGQWYFNQFYMPPPWHFPFVITAVVVPLSLFILFFVGVGRVLMRKAERPFGWYLILNGFVPMLALAIGQSMVYDNDRLFISAMPFIAALAAVGFDAVVQLLGRWLTGKARSVVVGLLVVAVLLPQAWAIRSLYPHLLSYYTEAIGGVAGATKMGLEATYWCETYNEVLDYLNENAKVGDVVYIDPYSHDVMYYYQRQGQLRDDILFTSTYPARSIFNSDVATSQKPFSRADFVVFQNRGTTFGVDGLDSSYAKWLAKQEPDFEFAYGDVPLIVVYQK
ncbi:MAG: glycosyltransferase family 39 protein [Anaerolineae bacterium]|nr:glycosyltransferase family 39 protein [Anaerolineae bacterium]